MLKAIPIFRKVLLNLRFLCGTITMRTKFGYTRDISDFLVKCVEDFFKSSGYKIAIEHEED